MRTIRKVLELFGIVAMVCLCIASSRAGAAGLDGSTPMLCVFTRAVECDGKIGCEGSTVEDMNLPQFFKIDFRKKAITPVGVASEVAAAWETKIKDFQRMDGKMFLQGIEVRGWSIVISEQTGKMSLTASGDDEAFVLFGVCIPQ
jgi:hypothetical protein